MRASAWPSPRRRSRPGGIRGPSYILHHRLMGPGSTPPIARSPSSSAAACLTALKRDARRLARSTDCFTRRREGARRRREAQPAHPSRLLLRRWRCLTAGKGLRSVTGKEPRPFAPSREIDPASAPARRRNEACLQCWISSGPSSWMGQNRNHTPAERAAIAWCGSPRLGGGLRKVQVFVSPGEPNLSNLSNLPSARRPARPVALFHRKPGRGNDW